MNARLKPLAGYRLSGRRRHGDEGITIVFVALAMVAVLFIAALVIDGGVAYVSHRHSQNEADSGTMAGVRVLEQLKFYPVCSITVPAPCTNFTSTSQIRPVIMQVAQKSGADTTAGAVTCYLLDANKNRVGLEFCDSGVNPTAADLAAASGVEVKARQTKNTFFAGTAGFDSTPASSAAKAFISNFVGGTGSPFIVCGVLGAHASDAQPLAWAYNLVTPNSGGGYSLVPGAAGQYYQIQGSQNPTCGADSNTFKGKGDGKKLDALPIDTGITTGNGFQNNIQLSVAGLIPCKAGDTVFNGCGMLIPIADSASGSGNGTKMHVVTWLAWQVWGSGNSYTFVGSSFDPLGSSCGNPISPGGAMKYCGKLLGMASVTGGTGGGPGTLGQLHVLRLSE